MMTYTFECAACTFEMAVLVSRAPASEFVEGEEYDVEDTIMIIGLLERCPQCGEPLDIEGEFIARHGDVIDDLLSEEEGE